MPARAHSDVNDAGLGARLTAFLELAASAPDDNAVAAAVCDGLLAPFGSDNAVIYVARTAGRFFQLIAHAGWSTEVVHAYRRVVFDARTPLTTSYVDAVETFYTRKEIGRDFPVASHALTIHANPSAGETGCFPLRHAGIPFGVVCVHFDPAPVKSLAFARAVDGLQAALSLWAWNRIEDPSGWSKAGTHGSPPLVTDRQRQILQFIAEGMTNSEIARRLAFSENTIKADLTALYRLLGASGRRDLIERARRSGLA